MNRCTGVDGGVGGVVLMSPLEDEIGETDRQGQQAEVSQSNSYCNKFRRFLWVGIVAESTGWAFWLLSTF
jgi:hypothetical protein